jgi:Mn2+/Fe2+ NRAMP family transporter
MLNNAVGYEEEEDAEDDPQDIEKGFADFLVAIGFILFGLIAFIAGVISICTES